MLDRYALLLRYGYGYHVSRGSRHWQALERAQTLRDYWTHLDVNDPRSLSSTDVLNFMEAVLVGIIWPSSEIGLTQLIGIYYRYWIWDEVRRLAEQFHEKPFFLDWTMDPPYTVYCPFKNVDSARFVKN